MGNESGPSTVWRLRIQVERHRRAASASAESYLPLRTVQMPMWAMPPGGVRAILNSSLDRCTAQEALCSTIESGYAYDKNVPRFSVGWRLGGPEGRQER